MVQLPEPEGISNGDYEVSPDRTLLAYWKGYLTADKLHYSGISIAVEDASGAAVAELRGEIDEWDSFYWLDNERVVIGMYGLPSVYDLFSGEKITPNWFAGSPGGVHIVPLWEVTVIFDTTLTRLFYMQQDTSLILMEVESKRVLRKIDSAAYNYFPPPLARPKWSWDDKQIVFAVDLTDDSVDNDEFFSLDREGNLTQLTNLGAYYSEYFIGEFSWSPDGRLIAFIVTEKIGLENQLFIDHLAVLDMNTLAVRIFGGKIAGVVSPVWSIDGQQILVDGFDVERKMVSTILYDLSQGFAATLVEGLAPAGWMVAP